MSGSSHIFVLKRNKFQRWLLIASCAFFLIALVAIAVNNWQNKAKQKDLSDVSLSEVLEKANTKYANNDFDEAIPYLEEAAKRGNARAQYSLGYMYEHGEGFGKSIEKAKEFYGLAAKQGHSKAKSALKKLGK